MPSLRISFYIFREVAVPTFLGLTIFTFVLLMGRILKLVEMMINKGVPLAEILKLFLYLLPSFFVITLPLAFLLGILLGFGRLSADSEIIALKSSGISLYGLLRPVLLLAIAASLATAFLTLYAQPRGKSAFRNQVFQIVNNRASVGLQPRVFNDEFDGLVIYTNDIEERSGLMQGILISDERTTDSPSIILARTGRIISDAEALTLTLRLKDGTIHRRRHVKGEDIYQVVQFGTYDVNLNMGQQLNGTNPALHKKDSEMTLAELRAASRNASAAEERDSFLVELHQRIVLPMAPLLFALIGVPLSIQSRRSGKGSGFALALVISLVYYFFLSGAKTMGEEGLLPPALAMWLPNLIFLAGGLLLFHQAAQEKRPVLLDWIADLPNRISTLTARRR